MNYDNLIYYIIMYRCILIYIYSNDILLSSEKPLRCRELRGAPGRSILSMIPSCFLVRDQRLFFVMKNGAKPGFFGLANGY